MKRSQDIVQVSYSFAGAEARAPFRTVSQAPGTVICAYAPGKAEAVIRACELGMVSRLVLGAALERRPPQRGLTAMLPDPLVWI